ncbi:hypothetical protein [Streptomyces sp. Z26]|uniref:hypothetical protein n=1 Tax=Streptomyces sp. Z26 TaxID=2500177 RepID=UPI000EF15172|nr:hypothetical protein [Streptomyces sp. Z26]RLL65603.1 hypothetical protein D7M15_00360 [Streptomyces sp. Z26]
MTAGASSGPTDPERRAAHGAEPGEARTAPPAPELTRAQRRAVSEADPDTGRVGGGAPTLRKLAAYGLALPYGRFGAHYLTAAGRDLRHRLLAEAAGPARVEPGAGGGAFTPADGDGHPPADPEAHLGAARRAWDALLEIRRVTAAPPSGAAPDAEPVRDPRAVPAGWERARPLHAVALALESAGVPPSAVDGAGRRVRTGYRVAAADDEDAGPDAVRVEWRHAAGTEPVGGDAYGDGPAERLDACARLLAARGWDAERYLDSRRRRHLLVTPRRAT